MTTELLRPFAGPKVLSLWRFQEEAIDMLRVVLRSGKRRIILCAPTGSGKTEMAIHLIQEAQAKGSRVTFVVDGISLTEQTNRTVHDGVWEAEVSVGLAKYQRPVMRMLDVLDGSHEQVAGFARAGRATVEQIGTLLISPKRLQLLVRGIMPPPRIRDCRMRYRRLCRHLSTSRTQPASAIYRPILPWTAGRHAEF